MKGAHSKMGKLVKKHPSVKALSPKQIHSTVYLKSRTPYVSALKRINKFLGNTHRSGSSYVTVLATGKAVEKALSLGCHFGQHLQKRVEVLTKSVEVIDEVTEEDDESDAETQLKKRTISGIELRIYP